MISTKSKLAAAAIGATMVAVPASALASGAINWQVPLKASAAYPTATGSAQYQAQPGQREIQVETEHLRSLAGKIVSFWAAGVKLGTRTVSSLGTAKIDRNTELGQSVPKIVHGSTVAVRSSSGALISSGRF